MSTFYLNIYVWCLSYNMHQNDLVSLALFSTTITKIDPPDFIILKKKRNVDEIKREWKAKHQPINK